MFHSGPILLIDALNLFARHYIRNPAMSSHGHHAGGIVGFMNALRFLVQHVHPSVIYIAWEGGGNKRRKAIFPGYKQNRRPPKLNRYYEGEIPDSAENRVQQITALVNLLKDTPVCQIYVEDCEADDVIGYLARNRFKGKKKIIASSDRDYYQLLDEDTMMYSWTSKTLVSHHDVLNEFKISAKNFIVAKVICGDGSDNIPGVKGVGFKTLAKRFPDLASEKELSVYDIVESAKKFGPKGPKMASNIVSNIDVIERNWRLMYLDISNLAAMQVRKIDASIDTFQPKSDKLSFMRSLQKEGLLTFDAHDFFNALLLDGLYEGY